jgi:DNA-binding XRE family transcriptional regulator
LVLNPQELKKFREEMNLTRKNLAAMLEVSEATIVRWEDEHKGKEPLEMKEQDSLLLGTLAWLHDKATKTKEVKEETVIYALILLLSGSTKHLKYLEKRYKSWGALLLSSTVGMAMLAMPAITLTNIMLQLFGIVKFKKAKSIEKHIEFYTEYGKTYGLRALLCIASIKKLEEFTKLKF